MRFRTISLFVFVIFATAITLMPFAWMISTSFKPEDKILTKTPDLIPALDVFTDTHYVKLFDQVNFMGHFFNSLIVTLGVTFFSLAVNAAAAYAFAKLHFPKKERLFALLLITMMIPMQVTMIPSFIILKYLGLLNSYAGLIIPGGASVYGIFLLRQFMMSIPNSLLEAARIDGCGEWTIFWRIVLPLCRPVLATLTIFTFIGAWNDFLGPLIILLEESKYTLPVALATLNGQYGTEWGLLMAGSVIVVVPVVIVFLLVQRHYIKGLMVGGVKG
ncbi:MAG: sugar ABC transporter permease [Elusimicrobia bacterium RIFCSPHIGHO2_02_FULL_61_10]|nr:MAG: sugar ABC transporter permease [Candidatus Lindowbacteria bacterium RIFCSPLOWO2_12_FULL_62_27]OGH61907.1 MAG: sugar ABC transporter permease [Candidatus Lindowbacteria bacterium RIFCSPLOWO2_02_FULL_62_12]OGS18104.1 MAG: sugar ABC transporter permease [Elusimicrobia bacterium RIFCSPHIGHO2_02_FULL_61_10]